jgi:hypothetical protein
LKARNVPKCSKNLGHFTTFFLEIWWVFLGKFFQKVPMIMLLGTFFNSKMVKIRHKKTHWHLSEKSQQAHQHRLIALPIMASSPIQTKSWAGTQLGGLKLSVPVPVHKTPISTGS